MMFKFMFHVGLCEVIKMGKVEMIEVHPSFTKQIMPASRDVMCLSL